jgi:ubiquinone/menaquinone biosynthesis C-methylase UbiE
MLTRLPHLHGRPTLHRRGTIDGWHSRVYDPLARWLLRGFYRRVAGQVADAAPSGAKVLDVGTGPGLLLAELARRRQDLTLAGVDLSPDMIRLAQRNTKAAAQVEVRVADVAALPYADGSVDLAISTMSQHHWQAVSRAVAELARVLRPGGRLLIYDLRIASTKELVAAARDAFPGQPLTIVPIRGRVIPWALYFRAEITRPTTIPEHDEARPST